MSDTPRTDAEQKWLFSINGQMQTICVHSEFARQLERELNGWSKCAEMLRPFVNPLHCEFETEGDYVAALAEFERLKGQ